MTGSIRLPKHTDAQAKNFAVQIFRRNIRKVADQIEQAEEAANQAADNLIGYRYEFTNGQKLYNFNGNQASAGPCEVEVLGNTSTRSHRGPHPDCTCGLRLVGDINILDEFVTDDIMVKHSLGFDPWEKEPGKYYGARAIARVRATGYVLPGTSSDPPMTLRARHLELLDIYATPEHDKEALAQAHGVPVWDLETEAPGLFKIMNDQSLVPDPNHNRITEYGNWFRIIIGHREFDIYKGWLTDRTMELIYLIVDGPVDPNPVDEFWEMLKMNDSCPDTEPRMRYLVANQTALFLYAMATRPEL